MSFDFLLANLLFGMTLLTASMAAAHFIGDFLADRMSVTRKARTVIRVMSLVSCSLLSLLLFLVKLSGPEINKAFAPGAGSFEPRLSKKVKVSVKHENVILENTPDELSWTFVNVLSPEIVSELKLQTDILKNSGRWYSLVRSQGPKECVGWTTKLQQLGLMLSETSTVPAQNDGRVLVCASEKHSLQTWQNLRELVSRGGSVFFVGRFVDQDSATLSQLLQIKSWRKPESGAVNNFIFGGQLFSYGAFPLGLKVSVPADWNQADSQAVVVADGQNQLWGSGQSSGQSEDVSYTSFIVKSFAKGRVAWTSLPALLSEKNKYLYGEYWNLAVLRTLSYLARMPSLGISNYPTGIKSMIVPTVHAEYDFKNARSIQEQLEVLKVPASFYAVMSEILNDKSTMKQISSQEIGAGNLNHNPLDGADFYERVMQLQKWKEAFSSLGYILPTEAGALVLPGVSSPGDSLAAAMVTRFSYVLGDPFNTSFTPLIYALKRTSDIKKAVLDKNFSQLKTGSDEIAVLPIATGDDFEFYQDGHLADASVIERSLQRKSQLSAWTGGPLVLTVHTQILGSTQGQASLMKVLKDLQTSGATFLSAKDYMNWWQNKSSLELKAERVNENEIVLRVMNVGVNKIVPFSLVNTESDLWKAESTSGGGVEEAGKNLNFKGLEPGESFSVIFKKRSL